MLLCVGSSIIVAQGVGSLVRLAGPAIAAQDYYRAIEQQDYTKAYTYLDSNATLTVNGQSVPVTQQDEFTTEATIVDSTSGPVSYFRANINGNDYARVDVTVTRNGPSYLVHLQLQQVGNTWKIISADGI